MYMESTTEDSVFQTASITNAVTDIQSSDIITTYKFKPKLRVLYSDFLGYEMTFTEIDPGSLSVDYEYNGVKGQKIIPVQVSI